MCHPDYPLLYISNLRSGWDTANHLPTEPPMPLPGPSVTPSGPVPTVMPRPEAPIEAELADSECHDVHLATRAFKNVATPGDIRNFLKQCPLYNTRERRWIVVPVRPTEEAQLYRPFIEILSAILGHFGLSTSREVHDTHNIELWNVARGQDILHRARYRPECNSPSICVRAVVQDKTLPSNFPFFDKQHSSNTQYIMVVSPIKVMTEKDFEDVEKGVYPRQNRARLYSYARFGLFASLFVI